jgi:hypothetical protein
MDGAKEVVLEGAAGHKDACAEGNRPEYRLQLLSPAGRTSQK